MSIIFSATLLFEIICFSFEILQTRSFSHILKRNRKKRCIFPLSVWHSPYYLLSFLIQFPICILFYVCVCLFYFGLCFYHFCLILFLIVLPASIKPLSKFWVFVLLFDARFLCFILFLFTPFQSIHLACI